MRKFLILPLLCAALLPASAALGQAPPAPPTTPVTDDNGASALTRAYLIFHAGDISNNRNRGDRITVTNVDPACRHADNVPRFLCVARLDLTVSSNRDDHRDRYHVRSAAIKHGGGFCDDRYDRRDSRNRDCRPRPPRPQPQRDRTFSCVVALRIVGGPVVAPTTSVLASECVNTTPRPTPR